MMSDCSIGLVGFMATGKTTIGKKLAAVLGRRFLDTDEIIEARERRLIADIFAESGETYFRSVEKQVVQEVCRITSAVISFGGGILLSDSNASLVKKHTYVVLLTASVETILQRIQASGSRPLLMCTKKSMEDRVRELLTERRASYRAAKDIEICTDTNSVEQCVKLIRRRIGL
jgi:shikimate kinase